MYLWAILGGVTILVVLGNCVVLYVLVSQPSLHSPTNRLVFSLTIADLFLGACILPFAIIQEQQGVWLFGAFSCRLWICADVWLSTASIYNLLAISIDRYMAVTQPIRYPSISSARVTWAMVFLVWMSSFSLACILFTLESVGAIQSMTSSSDMTSFFENPLINNNYEEAFICSPMQLPDFYVIFSALASFVLPALLMIILNVSIFFRVLMSNRAKQFQVSKGNVLRVHRGKSTIYNKPRSSPVSEETALNADSDSAQSVRIEGLATTLRTFLNHVIVVGSISEKKRHKLIDHIPEAQFRERQKVRVFSQSLRTELRVARSTAIVVAAFILCWIPFSAIYVMQIGGWCVVPSCIHPWVFTVAFWLGYSNSALNPLLYSAFSRDFRSAIKKVIFGTSLKRSYTQSQHTQIHYH